MRLSNGLIIPRQSRGLFVGLARFSLVAALLVLVQSAGAAWLWQIGQEDGQYKEFALADQGIEKYANDPVFVVGSSEASKDWPFIQPGPQDGWGGNKVHTFSIVFGLAEAPKAGDCVLHVALVDTQPQTPPMLNILINGKEFDQQMPRGHGGNSFRGHAEKGAPFKFDIHFSPDLLRSGPNLIDIVGTNGSWILYDAVAMSAPRGAALQKISSYTIGTARTIRALAESKGKLWQPIEMTMRHGGPAVTATVSAEGTSVQREIDAGSSNLELLVPPVKKNKSVTVSISAAGQTFTTSVLLQPVRKLTIYVLPHSHHDLGYTDLQVDVEKKQMDNLKKAIEIAQKTADYPEGAKFVWDTEVLWSVDQFLHRQPEADKQALIEAIKKGQIGLNGMYANELTGLCRPEELLELFRYGTQLSEQTGVKIDTAFLSDVPGMTWGTCTAFAQAGIRYFSLAPNHFDRIGTIMVAWQDKPFWWVSPSGKDKVLVWVPWMGYGLSHVIGEFSDGWINDYQQRLDDAKFPYDISYVRWAGHGDNGAPDPAISDFVKNWSGEYAWPKFRIASAHEMFTTFEKKYGDKLPEYKGDLTPYWEDGAASSALETGINRNAADRLVQAEAVFAMQHAKNYPADAVNDAWRNVLLYSEHTWGAWCSVSQSEWAFTKAQWAFKRAFAIDAQSDAEKLLDEGLALGSDITNLPYIYIFNTTSWPRTELAIVPKNLAGKYNSVWTGNTLPIPSQRLANGDLAILAKDIPPFSSIAYRLGDSAPNSVQGTPATANSNSLDNGIIHVTVDEKTGGISELIVHGSNHNFAQTANGESLNEYVYLPGANLADLQGSGPPKITVVENGPLVAELRIESAAAGCNSLTRYLRLVAGADYVEITNTLDKKRVVLNPDPNDNKASGPFAQHGSKESVNFAFPFNVANGQIRLDIPLASMRPEADQIPGACKDWLPVGRYADVSNGSTGVTLATLDAPLVQIGQLSTLLGSQRDPSVWRKHIEPTQKIYSWIMNNYWGTNYRAYQEGLTTFRYALRPHGKYDPAEAARFSRGLSQPLVVATKGANTEPLLRVEPGDVLVTDLKPSDDGHAWIVRLFGASGKDEKVKLTWASPAPTKISLSDTSEKPLADSGDKVRVPGWGLVTLRAEYP